MTDYNKKIAVAAIALIKRFRSLKEDGQRIANYADRCFHGDRDAAAEDAVYNISEVSDLIESELHDEVLDLVQALLEAEVYGSQIEDWGCYLTKEEYTQAQEKATADFFAGFNHAISHLADAIKNV